MKNKYSRREFLKTGALSGSTLLAGGGLLATSGATASMKSNKVPGGLDITIAGYPFDHVRPLIDGSVQVEGCNATFEHGKIGDLNTHVFDGPQKLEVTEVGLSPFMLAYANQGFRDYSLIPVFPLRLFRHKSIFINTDSGIRHPEDLKGKRVGTPGYSSTSLTWIRGFLQHEYEVRPEDLEWVVSAADSSAKDAGKMSEQENIQPKGISVSVGPEGKDESDILVDGYVDALFHAAEPRAFTEDHPKIKRLLPNPRKTERDYYSRTGIFPIMHAVAVRNDIIDKHPWLPEAVFNAYAQAKQVRYDEMQMGWVLGTLPWYGQELEETRAVMGENFWPYGIEDNLKTLNALFQYSHEQGLAKKRLSVEELFHPSTLHFTDLS